METPWKPLETWGFQKEHSWKPLETWKPGVARQETPWKPLKHWVARRETSTWEPGVAREETTGKLGVNLMDSTEFHLGNLM